MSGLDERELIRRCRDGDQEAFRQLVERFQQLVFGLTARVAGDRAIAEDLAQEVFLRVHRGLPYFRGESRLSTWIYRIASNVCAQELGRRPAGLVSLDDRGSADRPAREPGARDAAFDEVELRDRLEKGLARLPPQYRLLVESHYLEGLQYEELAEALGLPIGTVKTQLHRAKRRLREWLSAPRPAP